MAIDDLTIIYNGEIYNLSEVRNKILKHGLNLKTKSDTELILKMYKISEQIGKVFRRYVGICYLR